MPEKLSQRDSLALYFVKAVAILSSVAAHTSVIDRSTAWSSCVTRLWDMFSCISVGAFLVVGGILYTRKSGDTAVFWKRKAKYMILPWIFCSLLTYGYRFVSGHPCDLLGYIRYVLGIGTWYYYVTVYLVMMIVFKPIWRKPAALWGCVAVSGFCLTLRAYGVEIPLDRILDSEYIDPLYWLGFFALGILLRRRALVLSRAMVAVSCAVFAVSAVVVYRNSIFNYFHIINSVYSLSGFVVLLSLGRRVADTPGGKYARWIGSSTYCIYLLHMPLAQIALRRLPSGGIMYLLAPIVGVAVMLVFIELGKWISRKLPFGETLRLLVGLR